VFATLLPHVARYRHLPTCLPQPDTTVMTTYTWRRWYYSSFNKTQHILTLLGVIMLLNVSFLTITGWMFSHKTKILTVKQKTEHKLLIDVINFLFSDPFYNSGNASSSSSYLITVGNAQHRLVFHFFFLLIGMVNVQK
jgi:hypothetical protein